LKNHRVLIVDDDLKNIRLIASILQEAGLDFSYASSAREGLRLLRQAEFDLLLLDVMMPELDGYEFIEIIRKFRLFKHMPIILITVKGEREDILRGFDMGAQDYIVKPFEKDELLARINNLLKIKERADGLREDAGKMKALVGSREKELSLKEEQLILMKDVAKIRFMSMDRESRIFRDIDFLQKYFDMEEHAELSANDWLQLIHSEDRLEMRKMLQYELILKNRRLDATVRMLHPSSKSLYWFRIVAQTTDGEDDPVYFIFQDLTEEMAMRISLERRQRLQSLGQLAAGITHDFNNIITALLSAVDLLSEKKLSENEKDEITEGMRDSCQRGISLTRQILDFAKAGENRFEKISLENTVTELQPMLKQAVNNRCRLEYDLHPGKDSFVYADKNKIGQVLLNLVINARDAMKQGGRLKIELSKDVLEREYLCSICHMPMSGEYIIISVHDEGEGIPAEDIDHIFEPFYSTKGENGSGLGLAQVYGIITQSHGHIRVESSPVKGTSFHVYLPAVTGNIEMLPSTAQIIKGAGENILLIEDSDITRQTIEIVLTTMGYNVILAADAEEGLDIFQSRVQAIDLVICDIIMPGKNGDWVFEQVRSIEPDLPIIFMSSSPVNGAELLSRVSKDFQLFTKPIQREEWSRIISAALRKQRDSSDPLL